MGEASAAPARDTRIAWLDVARGIGIILVVAGHSERGLTAAGIAAGAGWRWFDLALYSFHMPLFMLLAGINIRHSRARGWWPFLRSKLRTVAYPYVLWSLIQGAVLVLLSSQTNSQTDWSALGRIGWQPIAPFWFLYALMVYVLLVAIMGLRASILIPVAIAGLIGSAYLDGDTLIHQLCYQVTFFVIGALGSQSITRWMPKPAWLWLVILIGCWWGALWLMPAVGATPYLTPRALPAALLGIAVVLVASQMLAGVPATALAWLGQWSMTIYVMHILATAGTRILLMKVHVPASPVLYMLACTLAGILMPVVAHLILKRLDLLQVFGLAGLASRAVARRERNIGAH